MAIATMRSGLTTSAGIRCRGNWPGLADLTKPNAHAAMQRATGRRMLVTASSVQKEHAETDKLDQKDLTQQKG